MLRVLAAAAGVLLPFLSIACQFERQRCKENFETLVAYRTEAIQGTFGDLLESWPADIRIEFVGRKSPEYSLFSGKEGYDQDHRRLILPLRFLGAKTPNPLRSARHYWRFYENNQLQTRFPVIETIDNLLWSAYLQEAAKERGLSWPHEDCASHDLARRLPCEMLVAGITEHVSNPRGPIFNTNRLDMIWPEDFADFRKHLWRDGESKYLTAERYGGILLLRPLIKEFGAPRAFAYIAKTPFQLEENNLRISALRYQERARKALW